MTVNTGGGQLATLPLTYMWLMALQMNNQVFANIVG